MKTIVTTLAVTSLVFGLDQDAWKQEFTDFDSLDHQAIWQQWKAAFGREYSSLEQEATKYAQFLDNMKTIADVNSQDLRYKLRLNQFGDMTPDEFRLFVHGSKGSCLTAGRQQSVEPWVEKPQVSANPTSIDWTNYNGKSYVTPVKNQGQCGSCWAFATTGSLECRYAIAKGTLTSLSEQQLVDCSWAQGNLGCDGGWWYNAYQYIESNGGLCTETEYPYTAHDGVCKQSSCGTKYDDMTNYLKVTADDEADLETAAASGCVAVGVEADQTAFQFYSKGILDGACGTNIDHGVLVVGYGTQNGEEYWKVKNSWGVSWGEQGYVLICKACNKNGSKGECGINMYPAYPNQF